MAVGLTPRAVAAQAGIIGTWLAALVAGCSGGGSGSSLGGADYIPSEPPVLVFAAGDTVAQVELELPAADPFVLRATLPVPRRVHPRGDGLSAFEFVDPEGLVYAAQVETVTRYPAIEDGADVVEVLARVARPASAVPGQRVQFGVRFQPSAPAPLAADPEVDALLATPGALVARSHDAFDHRYSADLWSAVRAGEPVRALRTGAIADQRVTHSVLLPEVPEPGATGTLPHMFGVHAYLTRWAGEPFFSLDLRVHNALCGNVLGTDVEQPLAQLYFEDFELLVPDGWVVLNSIEDPFAGTAYVDGTSNVQPLVRRIGDGTLHVIHQTGQFERRLVVCRAGHEARALEHLREAGLAFCRSGTNAGGMPLFSWWNESTARYFPQRQELPYLESVGAQTLRQADAAEYASRASSVATGSAGTWPLVSPGLGWAHPWGVSEAGMVSGLEIHLYDGVTTAAGASRDGYRLHQLLHRMQTDRQHNVLFELDGDATRWETWAVHAPQGSFLPVWWYNYPMLWAADPFGFSLAPTFQNEHVAATGRAPAYAQALLSHESIDQAHLIRYTRNPKVLVWLGNDALAKDDLTAQAEGILFTYTDLPQDLWGAVIPTGLLAAQTFVQAYPGKGVFYGRGEGWGLDLVSAVYSFQTREWRQRAEPWFGKVLAMLERGQSSCSGLIQNTPLGNVFNGRYGCHQSIEAAITENALVSMRESVFQGHDLARTAQVNRVLRRSAYGMIGPLKWSNAHKGPWALMAVAPADITRPQFCSYVPSDGNYGFADKYQIWSTFAYGYEVSGDVRFLNKAKEALGAADVHALELNPLDNLNNRCALLALVQRLP